ncbi:MAG TPA: efflux RND transporter permease subunit, partial [Candidatus Omnitrophota bacterium]|nr:efflux RND transporter permease subunit [Candidatus Omnitrophota bacterium]
ETYPELYDLIDNRVADALRQLPGVGTIQMFGGLERQINIWIDRQRLEAYGLSITDIQSVLSRENIQQPIGKIKTGLTDYLIRLPGEFSSPNEINSVIMGKRDGKYIYLKDVARVEDSFKEVTLNVRINQRRGLLMMILKQTDTNTVEVANRLKKRLKELIPTLPSDVKVVTIFDTSQDIIDSLQTLRSSVFIAIFLVICVVWFFLRRLFPSLIIAITIPFSLLISFIYLFLSGRTINTISLSSLAIVTGMVVDNVVVIVDNICRKVERGNRPQEAAIYGAQEMFLSVGASTMTTVVVFLPMLFIPGIIGIFFGELAVIITVTLLASFFTAVTFSPMLSSKLLTADQNAFEKHPRFARFYAFSENVFAQLEARYAQVLDWALRHRKTVILGAFGLLIATFIFLTGFIETEFSPEEDSGDVRLTIELPLGTRLEETDQVTKRIERLMVEQVPEALYYFARCGEVASQGRGMGQVSGENIITAGVKLVPKTQRKRSVWDVAQLLRNEINRIPGVMKIDVQSGNPIGRVITGAGGKAVQLEIIGNSFEETDRVAAAIKTAIEKIPGAVDVTISRELRRPELQIEIDREKAGSLGLNMSTIASSLKTSIQGSTATKYRELGQTYDIYVRLEESSRQTFEDIINLTVYSPTTQQQVRFSNFAKIKETLGPLSIDRLNRERVVRVECNTYHRSSGKLIQEIKKELKKIVIPDNIMVNFGGEAEEQKKAFGDLGLLLILGIILVY